MVQDRKRNLIVNKTNVYFSCEGWLSIQDVGVLLLLPAQPLPQCLCFYQWAESTCRAVPYLLHHRVYNYGKLTLPCWFMILSHFVDTSLVWNLTVIIKVSFMLILVMHYDPEEFLCLSWNDNYFFYNYHKLGIVGYSAVVKFSNFPTETTELASHLPLLGGHLCWWGGTECP